MTRSTFSAELLGAGDASDQGILISHMLRELEEGVMTAEVARDLRMSGGYIPTALYIDAKSVFAAISATFLKQPAEKSLLCHVQYLRELLDKHILHSIVWLDTRDMGADGLTKGAVSREALHELMAGSMKFRHPLERWQSKSGGTRASEAQLAVPSFNESSTLALFVSGPSSSTILTSDLQIFPAMMASSSNQQQQAAATVSKSLNEALPGEMYVWEGDNEVYRKRSKDKGSQEINGITWSLNKIGDYVRNLKVDSLASKE